MPALNSNLQKLFSITHKPERLAIGLMSGTSLDGLDIALCRFKGSGMQTRYELLRFVTVPYTDDFRAQVKEVFASRYADLEQVCLLNAAIGRLHAGMIMDALKEWDIEPATIDFIASHGQTIYHAPRRLHGREEYPNATLQIGDGDHIAVQTGILTISDFRQKHIAAGGEGAPLALYGDVILGSKPGEERILLNLGGIANLTYLPADTNTTKIICTDISPGNTLIDAACRRYFKKAYDEGGQIAALGQIDTLLLNALLQHPFFANPAPKTTGPELFNLSYLDEALAQLAETVSPINILTTLTAFTARAIADFVSSYIPVQNLRFFVSGGGAHNRFLQSLLTAYLPQVSIGNSSEINLHPDAKEAILFAVLGNEALVGEPLAIAGATQVLMGKVSFAG